MPTHFHLFKGHAEMGVTTVAWRRWWDELSTLAMTLWAGGHLEVESGIEAKPSLWGYPGSSPLPHPHLLLPSPWKSREGQVWVWVCYVCLIHLCVPRTWLVEGLNMYTE